MMTSPQFFQGLVFHAGLNATENTFVLDVRHLREIVEMQKIHHLPGATAQEPGFILIRQEPVALLDLAAMCGIGSVETGAVVLVLEASGKKVGLKVGVFEDIEDFDRDGLQYPLHTLAQPQWVSGLVKTGKAHVAMLLNAPLLVSKSSRAASDSEALELPTT